jgi:hypothetical protein
MKLLSKTKSICLGVLLTSMGFAEEISIPSTLQVNGQTYTGVSYVLHDNARLKITHESGVANLLLSDLPSDLQKMLGFDKHKAEEEIAKQAAIRSAALAESEANAKLKAKEEERVKLKKEASVMAFDVLHALPDGSLYVTVCDAVSPSYGGLASVGGGGVVLVTREWSSGSQNALLRGYTKEFAEGDRVEAKAFESGVEEAEIYGTTKRKLRVYEVAE